MHLVFGRKLLAISLISPLMLAAVATLRAGPPGGDINKQRPRYHIDHIPPAPVLSAAEELKTFKLPPGFRIELVAAEPMVQEPVALTFDADGRMYVVEMRGYMPDIKDTGELDPVGRIVRLDSSGGDGKFDKVTTFLDHLVAPRAVGIAGDGVLVGEPPNVWFCRDTNGDGVCDEKKLIFSDYGPRTPNPEHKANGLMFGIDNWIDNADFVARFKYAGKGTFLREAVPAAGQWGIAQDDAGRLFFNSNSSMLRCDLVPSTYLSRNPYLGNPPGINVAIASNATFPSRVNPGVNRGYTEDVNLQGKLQRVTAACGPMIYRGDQFPTEYHGNAFVCEPAGNLVCRQVIAEKGLALTAKGVQHDGIDFLTSTDERFRPVSLYNGPDGALYVVDLYHGILQHASYMSAYLADQVKQRHLDDNDGHRGRIWRITYDGTLPAKWPKLSKAPAGELVKQLSNPNGWWRDAAQQVIVERPEKSAAKLLKKLIDTSDGFPLAKVHALWALQGLDRLEDEDIAAGLKDADPRVRLAALRAGEIIIRKHTAPLAQSLVPPLANDSDANVQIQVLLMSTPDLPDIEAAGFRVLSAHLNDPVFRAAMLNAAVGRELDVLPAMLQQVPNGEGKKQLLSELAVCVIRSRSADRINRLFDAIATSPADAKEAMLHGIADAIAPVRSKTKPVASRKLRLPAEPPAMSKLIHDSDKRIAALASRTETAMSWPGKPGDNTPPLKPLTEEQQKHYTEGQLLFSQICANCHQPSGLGMDGVAPPLVDSEWVLGPEQRVGRILLSGLHGPVKVGKKTVDMEMPALGTLTDEQIASILTYVRREWGHEADPVEVATIAKIRAVTANRGDAQWTMEELLKIK